ncbi:MAG: hypothetical protein P1U46_04765 [Patescibacteria group bacterium]|nr:hypothetical protein [Patescibacteria group bacterium]
MYGLSSKGGLLALDLNNIHHNNIPDEIKSQTIATLLSNKTEIDQEV